MCEVYGEGAKCQSPAMFLVNARLREAQVRVCREHLAQTVEELYSFNGESYKPRPILERAFCRVAVLHGREI